MLIIYLQEKGKATVYTQRISHSVGSPGAGGKPASPDLRVALASSDQFSLFFIFVLICSKGGTWFLSCKDLERFGEKQKWKSHWSVHNGSKANQWPQQNLYLPFSTQLLHYPEYVIDIIWDLAFPIWYRIYTSIQTSRKYCINVVSLH